MDVNTLRSKMLFLGLSDPQLKALAGIIRTRTFRPGDVIVRQGTLDDTLYVIERGSVELRLPPDHPDQRPPAIAVLERGSYVDEGYAGDGYTADTMPCSVRPLLSSRSASASSRPQNKSARD